MATRNKITAEWKTSSYSGGNGQCVEVRAPGAGAIAVRDSKDPQGPVLDFRPEAWSAFMADLGQGTLDAG